ncbi:MAG: hypothetical protein RBJ76_23500 [Stenomitos frigidus ULC029]
MEPLLVNEKLVSLFKFWANGKLQNGMRCSNELFRQVRTFTFDQRQKVYSLGWALAERGIRTVITWSLQGYALWVCMRSPNKLWNAAKETKPRTKSHISSTATSSNVKTDQQSSEGGGLQERVLVLAR